MTESEFVAAVEEYFISNKVATENRKILICHHGFNTQPTDWLEDCGAYPGNYLAVPVIWPCGDLSLFSYLGDQGSVTPGVANAFRKLLKNSSTNCPLVSWLIAWGITFSSLAAECGDTQEYFTDTFMVAADVRESRNHARRSYCEDAQTKRQKSTSFIPPRTRSCGRRLATNWLTGCSSRIQWVGSRQARSTLVLQIVRSTRIATT